MKIEETRISLINQLIALVNKYCTNLKVEDDIKTLFFYHKKSWFSRYDRKLYIYSPSSEDKPSGLFGNGIREDIRIVILNEEYFECAQKVAEDYERVSQKTATVVRAF
ncbi:MAG: hypothetical protein E3K37_12920 [Candidatus Kuenenia sp.]|nr:hypothetical protein [Candidatus Kuenenia hertensis]